LPALGIRGLTRDYRLEAADGEMLRPIGALECSPLMPDRDLDPLAIAVTSQSGFLGLTLPDGEDVRGSASHVINAWYDFVNREMGDVHAGTAFVPAALVSGSKGRVLLVGGRRSARSTLVLDLLTRGFAVEGDDHALVDWGVVVMRPRRLHAPPDAIRRVPQAAPLIEEAPRVEGWFGQAVAAVDPSLPGRPWTIRKGPVAHVVFLEPNPGGRSVMGPISSDTAFSRLLSLALMPETGVALALAKLRALAVSAPAFVLSLGDLDGAHRHLSHLLGIAEGAMS
jgi:hypothetical protein